MCEDILGIYTSENTLPSTGTDTSHSNSSAPGTWYGLKPAHFEEDRSWLENILKVCEPVMRKAQSSKEVNPQSDFELFD